MQNDGGIKRGDRADTGDDKAGKKDGVGRGGSGVPGGDGGATGHVTGATDSLAESVSGVWTDNEDAVQAEEDVEEVYISGADDPELGLTDILDRPAEGLGGGYRALAKSQCRPERSGSGSGRTPDHAQKAENKREKVTCRSVTYITPSNRKEIDTHLTRPYNPTNQRQSWDALKLKEIGES
ncbi:MAG: hypothetical protein ACRD30_01220 [Bryobacteraceae bacterium]